MKKILFALGLVLGLVATAQASPIRAGTGEINGTFSFDFETGDTSTFNPGADIFWEWRTATTRDLKPSPFFITATLIALGSTSFAIITEADLLAYVYSATPIEGPPAASLLEVGNTFAVFTTEGNYAKVLVTGYDNGTADRPYYDMQIQYALFDGLPVSVPEPGSLALLGLAGLLVVRQRRG